MYKIKLSPYSKTFYTEWLLYPDNKRNNMLIHQKLYGTIDVSRFKKSLIRFVKDHVLVNSHVLKLEEEFYWVQNDYIHELEYSENINTKFEIIDYINKSFDLNNGPLYRFKLLKLKYNVYQLIIVVNHMIIDGASANYVFDTISNYYNDVNYKIRYDTNEQIELINNLTETLNNNVINNQNTFNKFWNNILSDANFIDLKFLKLNLNTFKNKPKKKYAAIEEINFNFSKEVLDQLNKLKHKYIITSYIYGLSLLAMLLYRYTKQKRFAICYSLSIKEGIDFIYGGQVNTSLIVYNFDENTSLQDIFAQSRNFFKSLKNQGVNYGYYPINDIIKQHDKQLLSVFYNQANFRNSSFAFEGITKSETLKELNRESIDFLLFEQELQQRELVYRIRYDSEIFNKELFEGFVLNYKYLFTQLLNDLLETDNIIKINSYPIFNQKTYKQIIYDWNNTEVPLSNETIPQLFEKQASINPNSTAIVYKDKKVTFKQLNQSANQLAHYIRKKYNIKKNYFVVLCLEKNECLPTVLFAILKLGATYVPLDPSYPDKRIFEILKDTKPLLIISSSVYFDRFTKLINDFELMFNNLNNDLVLKPQLLIIENKETQRILSTISKRKLNIQIMNTDLAYVIYTSGTTGKPKGVMIAHQGVINLVFFHLQELINYKNKKNYLWYANLTFDAHVWEFYLPLLTGNPVYLIDEPTKLDIKLLSRFIKANNISIATIPPYILDIDNILPLETLIVAGDKTNEKILERYFKTGIKVINAYGSTETTVCTHVCHYNPYVTSTTTIGKPIFNTKSYILDDLLKPMPIGAVGELYIGGIGLAKGYLNIPDLTQDRFIDNPFFAKQDKIYKSGDLARWLPDGNIEFIGRNDSEIKIRGYRVEVKEIENILMQYPSIKQAVVISSEKNNQPNRNQHLIGYYVAENKLDEKEIFNYLNIYLPKFMKLDSLIYKKKLPVNLHGKLDYNALIFKKTTNKYLPPSNILEKKVCKAYSEILNIPESKVSVNDDFFCLGGNSLLVIKLTVKLQYDFKINTSDVLELRTPAKIAKFIVQEKNTLRNNVGQIKLLYNMVVNALTNDKHLNDENVYQSLTKTNLFYDKPKKIEHVLLTGATGHLGCHILFQMLKHTNNVIYILVRAKSEEDAYIRVKNKFKYYFDIELNTFGKRVIILMSNIEKVDLGLNQDLYHSLTTKINRVIHCAATIKHYGKYDNLHKANVQTTENLLEFTKLTEDKDFNYISTISLLLDGYIPEKDHYSFSEDENIEVLVRGNNTYIQTKYEAEKLISKYRNYGIDSCIYRVGNLVMNSENYRIQESYQENLFYNHCKAMVRVGILPHEAINIEVSPVDYTALAIVKIFNRVTEKNITYHLFNPHTCNLLKIFSNSDLNVRESSMEEFVDKVLAEINMNMDEKNQMDLFMLYQLWSNIIDSNKYITKIKILQSKTQSILKDLDFEWPVVNKDMFLTFINKIKADLINNKLNEGRS